MADAIQVGPGCWPVLAAMPAATAVKCSCKSCGLAPSPARHAPGAAAAPAKCREVSSACAARRRAQAQTAELRASIDAIRGLVSSLEAQQRERGEAGAAGAAGAPDGGLTVAELRRELRSFADTLHE